MASPLAGLARTVGNAFASTFYDATLSRDGANTGPSYDPTPGAPTTYPCKSIVEAYSEKFRLDGTVGDKDRKVLILANSLGVRPAPNDRITISGITFTILEVSTDPAEAVWECRGKM